MVALSRIGTRRVVLAALTVAALAFGGAASAQPLATAPPPVLNLAPASSGHITGTNATLTATLTSSGRPLPDQTVTFTVDSGPNAGATGSGVTDANGKASFTYSSSKTGTDHVTAHVGQLGLNSNDAAVTWTVPARADVQLTLAAPFVMRVGKSATFTAKIANVGPDAATGVSFSAPAPAGFTLVSATAAPGSCNGSTCPIGTLAAGASATVTLVYTAGQAGAATLSAAVQSDFDPNEANNAAAATTTVLQPGAVPPPPPPPAQPGIFNAIGTGAILVNGVAHAADEIFQLNSGDAVDVTDGVLTFTAADGSYGSFSSSQPQPRRRVASVGRAAANLPARFAVSQPASGGPTTLTLTGGDFSSCGARRSEAASKKPIRQLWGSAKGTFKTTGRYASATVRGTIWLVQDRCDGTLTQVVEGTVDVLDTTRAKTVAVPAGGSYLAAPLTLPPQSAAWVAKHGLKDAGKTYATKTAFTRRLKTMGYAWRDFAKRYPKLAAALAHRK